MDTTTRVGHGQYLSILQNDIFDLKKSLLIFAIRKTKCRRRHLQEHQAGALGMPGDLVRMALLPPLSQLPQQTPRLLGHLQWLGILTAQVPALLQLP